MDTCRHNQQPATAESFAIAHVRASAAEGMTRLFWLPNQSFFDAHPERKDSEFQHVRILRKTIGPIDERHANCCLPFGEAGATCVYDGPVAPTPAGAYEWTEQLPQSNVETVNYVYLLATATTSFLELRPLAARHPEIWWRYEKLMQRLHHIAESQPSLAKLSICGRTTGGREIPRIAIGTGAPSLGLIGLVHAGESGPELIVPVLERLMENDSGLLDRAGVVAVPALNIDQREKMARGWPYYLRANPAGIDLNRNFPAFWESTSLAYGLSSADPDSPTFRGSAPACAPETQAAMAALEHPGLQAVFSFHWHNSICALPALSCEMCAGDAEYMNKARALAQSYAKGLYPERAYEEWFHGTQAASGSLPAWLYQPRRIPAFDLEGGTISLKYSAADHTPFDLSMLEDYRERHYRAVRNVLNLIAEQAG